MKRLALAILVLVSGCASIPPVPTPTARCNDGSHSFSGHRGGTCLGQRGGVAEWLAEVPP